MARQSPTRMKRGKKWNRPRSFSTAVTCLAMMSSVGFTTVSDIPWHLAEGLSLPKLGSSHNRRLSHFRSIPVFVMNQMTKRSLPEDFSTPNDQEFQTADNSHMEIKVYTTQHLLERIQNFNRRMQHDRKQKIGTREAARFVHYMKAHPVLVLNDSSSSTLCVTTTELQDAIQQTMVTALRMAGESMDYRLILQLITAVVEFANNHPILSPRIFGEAIEAMSRTQANVAKLKSVWNQLVCPAEEATYLASPPTAFELNVFLKALASRGKSRACVDTFKQHVRQTDDERHDNASSQTHIQPDAYTLSTLFSILTDSISSDQKLCDSVVISSKTAASSSPSSLYNDVATLTRSPCWQWNAAVECLDIIQMGNGQSEVNTLSEGSLLTNHVYCSLLKLQINAQEAFVDHENGPRLTVAILDHMVQRDVIPDQFTCSLAIKAMGQLDKDARRQTQHGQNPAVDFLLQMKSNPKLPNPNQHAYSAAITACARQRNYTAALQLLEEMKAEGRKDSSVLPNTWCYNAVLLSLDDGNTSAETLPDTKLHSPHTSQDNGMDRNERAIQALSLLDQMKADANATPDTVTYNTILGLANFQKSLGHSSEVTVLSLLDEMGENGIRCDHVTYRNAISASVNAAETISILTACVENEALMQQMKLSNDAVSSVFNVGLSKLAADGDFSRFQSAFTLMHQKKISMNADTVSAVIEMIEKGENSTLLIIALEVLEDSSGHASDVALSSRGFSAPKGDKTSNTFGIDASSKFIQFLSNQTTLPSPQDIHYTRVIAMCLNKSDFSAAHKVLSAMRDSGLQPSDRCMESFATAYAKSVISGLAQKSISQDGASSRAESAYKIAMAIKNPTVRALGIVAHCCAMSCQWKQARSLLRYIHAIILESQSSANGFSFQRDVRNVKKTQYKLLRECAFRGNMNAALFYTNDIQDFSAKFLAKRQRENNVKSISLSDETMACGDDFFSDLRKFSQLQGSSSNVGMGAQEWIYMIQAAAKAGDWRVCFNSLQFLRPYVERNRPKKSSHEASHALSHRYEELGPALTQAIRCLESHNQDAWAVRAILDWIQWSHRRPRAEAVLSAIRVLASKGLGDEVKNLVSDCLCDDLGWCSTKKRVGYEEMLYIGAVTSLHHSGLYDDADEIFMSGISSGHLPFNFVRDENRRYILDLHGLNVALSHSAVRIAMRQHAASFDNEAEASDMMIITGRGKNSALHLRPVLRPEVQRMLMEEFYPPLNTLSVTNNIGALLVLSQDIQAWQQHQEEQKGARMMELASLLRNISDQDRLKKSIFASIKAIERDGADNGNNPSKAQKKKNY